MFLCGLGEDSDFLFTQQLVYAEPVQPALPQNVLLCAVKTDGEWSNFAALNISGSATIVGYTSSLLFEADEELHSVDVSDDGQDVEYAIIFVGSANADGSGAKLENMIIYSQTWSGNEPLQSADVVISDFLSSGLLTIPVVISTGSLKTLPSAFDNHLTFAVDDTSDISPTFSGCLGSGLPQGSLSYVQRDSLYDVSGDLEGSIDPPGGASFDTRFGIEQRFIEF